MRLNKYRVAGALTFQRKGYFIIGADTKSQDNVARRAYIGVIYRRMNDTHIWSFVFLWLGVTVGVRRVTGESPKSDASGHAPSSPY